MVIFWKDIHPPKPHPKKGVNMAIHFDDHLGNRNSEFLLSIKSIISSGYKKFSTLRKFFGAKNFTFIQF
jgi:hypothetical protein